MQEEPEMKNEMAKGKETWVKKSKQWSKKKGEPDAEWSRGIIPDSKKELRMGLERCTGWEWDRTYQQIGTLRARSRRQ